jgi:hypothetical protein
MTKIIYLTCYYSDDEHKRWTTHSRLAEKFDFMNDGSQYVHTPKDLDVGLNLLGQDGWELVAGWPEESKGIRFIFRKGGSMTSVDEGTGTASSAAPEPGGAPAEPEQSVHGGAMHFEDDHGFDERAGL